MDKALEEDIKTDFLNRYQPIHSQFIRYCNGKSMGIMPPEDLAQESILTTLTSYKTIKDKERLLGYMIGTANNIVKNQLRRRKFKADWDEAAFDLISAKVNDPEVALDIQYLYKCIEQLKPHQQECILLFEISGFSIKEVGVIQNVSPQAVKTRLHRARRELKKLMSEDHSPGAISKLLAVYSFILM